ncbi:MAG: hypothetical protein AB8B80_04710 [Marinicellaceae bacterium]
MPELLKNNYTNITFIFIGLLLPSLGVCKKLTIHRCELENGTISFQENKCPKKVTKTITNSKKASKKPKNLKNSIALETIKPQYKKPVPIKYKKFDTLNGNNNSVHRISDRVKSYNISIQGLKKWGVFKKVYNNKLLHIKYLDEEFGEEISLRIDFIFPDNKKFSDDELTELVYLVGSQYVNDSRERAIIPKKMNIQNGRGVMATFTGTNNSLKYQHTTRGAVFKGKWLIQFTLLSSNINSLSHQFTIQSLFDSIQISQ